MREAKFVRFTNIKLTESFVLIQCGCGRSVIIFDVSLCQRYGIIDRDTGTSWKKSLPSAKTLKRT